MEPDPSEEIYPTVLLCLPPALAVFSDTNNNVEAIVAGVQTLAVTLRAVSDESERVVLEIILEFSQGPVAPFVNDFLRASEVESLDPTYTL